MRSVFKCFIKQVGFKLNLHCVWGEGRWVGGCESLYQCFLMYKATFTLCVHVYVYVRICLSVRLSVSGCFHTSRDRSQAASN